MSETTTELRYAGLLAGLSTERLETADGTPTILIEAKDASALYVKLRDEAHFESVSFVTAVDRYPKEPRFEVSTQLSSLAHGDSVRIRILTREEDPKVPTAALVWPGARFMERECYDMFGITFEGHPDLRRLLMPDGYGHHPLRKDFPHQGIEPDRLYREWDEARRREWAERS